MNYQHLATLLNSASSITLEQPDALQLHERPFLTIPAGTLLERMPDNTIRFAISESKRLLKEDNNVAVLPAQTFLFLQADGGCFYVMQQVGASKFILKADQSDRGGVNLEIQVTRLADEPRPAVPVNRPKRAATNAPAPAFLVPDGRGHISFTKVALPNGWLGNMSAYPIRYNGEIWRTTEHLFQCMRFNDTAIINEIKMQRIFTLKKVANKTAFRPFLAFPKRGSLDVSNMREVLELKLSQYPQLKAHLLASGDALIYEDVGSRVKNISANSIAKGNEKYASSTFWGAYWDGSKLVGENTLGKLWMELRDALRETAV